MCYINLASYFRVNILELHFEKTIWAMHNYSAYSSSRVSYTEKTLLQVQYIKWVLSPYSALLLYLSFFEYVWNNIK